MILGLMLEQGMIAQAEYLIVVQEEINFVYNPAPEKQQNQHSVVLCR